MGKTLKNMGFILGVLIIIGLTGSTQEFPPRTQYVPHVGDIEGLEPPVIDGIVDDPAWLHSGQGRGPNQSFNHNNMIVKIFPQLPADDPTQPGVLVGGELTLQDDTYDIDLMYMVFMIYDDTYLYIAVTTFDWDWMNAVDPSTEDGETWNDDSVEIFIDGNHNAVEGNVSAHPEEYATGGQFVLTSNGARRDKEAGDPTFGEGADADWFAAVLENANFDGFNYEFRIKLSKIGNPQKGDTIGFNIAVNDSDTEEGTRDSQLLWVGEAHNESTYGDVIFGRREITVPLMTDSVVIDGKLDDATWDRAALDYMNIHTCTFNTGMVWTSMEDLSSEVLSFHDANYLYLGFDVTDDLVRADTGAPGSVGESIWNDDTVEIMIDGDLSRTEGNNIDWGVSMKIMISANNSINTADVFFYGEGENDDWYGLATETEKGYQIEVRIKKEVFMPDPTAPEIGFTLAIGDDDNDEGADGTADRDGQMRWLGTPNRENTYGVLIYGDEPSAISGWELH